MSTMDKVLNQKGFAHLLLLVLLVSGLAIGLYLVTQTQIFKSRASVPPIVFKKSDGTTLPKSAAGLSQSLGVLVRVDLTSPLGPPQSSVSAPPSSPRQGTTVSFRVAETPDDLNYGVNHPYLQEPSILSYQFKDGTPGIRNFWVEFTDKEGKTERKSAQLEITGVAPKPTFTPSPSPTVTVTPTVTPTTTPTITPTPSPTVPTSSLRVFVTSSTYNGNLGGLSGADAQCQSHAVRANLGGTWKAWLSDTTSSPSTRFNKGTGSYVTLSGGVVANNWTDLTDGTLGSSISTDETGRSWTNYLVWSSTLRNGTPMVPDTQTRGNCSNWTSSTNPANASNNGNWGNNGVIGRSDSLWTDDGSKPCNSNFLHLYCFEQAANVPVPSPTVQPTTSPSPSVFGTEVQDSFTRSNNSFSLGNAQTGQTWVMERARFGVNNNEAFLTGCPAPGYALINTGKSDGTTKVRLTNNTQDARVAFRYQDLNNHYYVERTGSGYQLVRVLNGAASPIGDRIANPTPKDGDIITISAAVAPYAVSVNDQIIFKFDDQTITGTKYGFGTWCDSRMRFDDFSWAASTTNASDTGVVTSDPTSAQQPTAGASGIVQAPINFVTSVIDNIRKALGL